MGLIRQRGSWVLLWWAIVRLVGGGGDWFTSVWLGGEKPSLCQSCAAKWTIWRAAQQQACTRVSIWAEWEWRLMNTVQMWVEGVEKRNLSIWCFNYCGWPPAGYKILQALDQGSHTQITWWPWCCFPSGASWTVTTKTGIFNYYFFFILGISLVFTLSYHRDLM